MKRVLRPPCDTRRPDVAPAAAAVPAIATATTATTTATTTTTTTATATATTTTTATTATHAALQRIGRAATVALYDELALAPKPGLVSFADSGSHRDMDARTFMRSLFALRHYFVQIAALGHAGAAFAALQNCGLVAEARMRAATGGVNTHRGAVFTLGLLCASAGAVMRDGPRADAVTEACSETGDAAQTWPHRDPQAVRAALMHHWGGALAARRSCATGLPGDIAARAHGLRSAAAEAAAGFPTLFQQVVPALQEGLRRGLPVADARVDALFHAMASLDDTNLVHRGGIAALRQVQASAHEFLAAGGISRPGGRAAAWTLHRTLVARRLSPGGAADTLAAACWVVRMVGTPPP